MSIWKNYRHIIARVHKYKTEKMDFMVLIFIFTTETAILYLQFSANKRCCKLLPGHTRGDRKIYIEFSCHGMELIVNNTVSFAVKMVLWNVFSTKDIYVSKNIAAHHNAITMWQLGENMLLMSICCGTPGYALSLYCCNPALTPYFFNFFLS